MYTTEPILVIYREKSTPKNKISFLGWKRLESFDVQIGFSDGSEEGQRRVLIKSFWSHIKPKFSDDSPVMTKMFVKDLHSAINYKVEIAR